MNNTSEELASDSDQSLSNRIDVICDAFERAWNEGKRPSIESYLDDVRECERRAFLRELLALELDCRQRGDELPRLTEYVQRFPHDEDLIKNVFWSASTTCPFGMRSIMRSAGVDSTVASRPQTLGALRHAAKALEHQLVDREFHPGEYLIRQGEPGDSLLIIQRGTVEVIASDETGTLHRVDRAGPGQIVGEMALLSDEPRSANVVAVDQVAARELSAKSFHQLAREFPEISEVLTNLMASRLGGKRRDVLAGKTFETYKIGRRLGRGGMGIVYRGIDESSGRPVALKMMNHRLVYDTEALDRFQREADIIESFDHENIIRMYSRFAAFHTYFIVLEFCDGQTLRQRMDLKQEFNIDDFRRVIGQLAASLHYAHSHGIIHRDVKPANVMITRDQQIKLMDFGLAQPVDLEGGTSKRIVGTPQYMAPEQLESGITSKASDYFSLGCVAYEMLQGKPLIGAVTYDHLRRIHENWQVPRIAELDREPTADINGLLKGALAADPDDRFVDLQLVSSWADS